MASRKEKVVESTRQAVPVFCALRGAGVHVQSQKGTGARDVGNVTSCKGQGGSSWTVAAPKGGKGMTHLEERGSQGCPLKRPIKDKQLGWF